MPEIFIHFIGCITESTKYTAKIVTFVRNSCVASSKDLGICFILLLLFLNETGNSISRNFRKLLSVYDEVFSCTMLMIFNEFLGTFSFSGANMQWGHGNLMCRA